MQSLVIFDSGRKAASDGFGLDFEDQGYRQDEREDDQACVETAAPIDLDAIFAAATGRQETHHDAVKNGEYNRLIYRWSVANWPADDEDRDQWEAFQLARSAAETRIHRQVYLWPRYGATSQADVDTWEAWLDARQAEQVPELDPMADRHIGPLARSCARSGKGGAR